MRFFAKFIAVLLFLTNLSIQEGTAQELQGAFLFGSRNLECEVVNEGDGVNYTMVLHVNGQPEPLEYTQEKGHGFEVISDDLAGRNGFARFGPFDDSANNRNRFGDTCPDEMYDSFIGFKNFATPCNETTEGNTTSCSDIEGGVFRVDVPNGIYRFVAVMGEADNPHTSRLVAENGGSGPPANMNGFRTVVLVNNHDQAQYVGGPRPDRLGAGVFAAVGFDGKNPPVSDADVRPIFINQDSDGNPTVDNGPPSSPYLAVTDGYIRFHCLQGNSNPGPGGINPVDGLGNGDANGGDIVLLEVWKVGDLPEASDMSFAGYAFLTTMALILGFVLLRRI